MNSDQSAPKMIRAAMTKNTMTTKKMIKKCNRSCNHSGRKLDPCLACQDANGCGEVVATQIRSIAVCSHCNLNQSPKLLTGMA